MSKAIWMALAFAAIVGCKKDHPQPINEHHPSMVYKNFADSSIAFGKGASFDLDDNGEKDILFSTQLVGDPIEQKDKEQWMVTTSFNANLPVNNTENIPVLGYLDRIPVNAFLGYTWYNASSILLSQKTITMTLPAYWEGQWKDVSHRFIAIQLQKLDGLYNGWIEVSFSMAGERLILHKAAICKEPNKNVLAGK
ncbi:MAG: hypothetical protein ACTHOF_12400 [Flavisolibacter sp.]|jgi:hypothetical protein